MFSYLRVFSCSTCSYHCSESEGALGGRCFFSSVSVFLLCPPIFFGLWTMVCCCCKGWGRSLSSLSLSSQWQTRRVFKALITSAVFVLQTDISQWFSQTHALLKTLHSQCWDVVIFQKACKVETSVFLYGRVRWGREKLQLNKEMHRSPMKQIVLNPTRSLQSVSLNDGERKMNLCFFKHRDWQLLIRAELLLTDGSYSSPLALLTLHPLKVLDWSHSVWV